MDKILRDLFKDGENDGDITLKCADQVTIKCHSLILKSQSDYFKGLIDFYKDKGDKKEFMIDYPSKIVRIMINKLYNSVYPIGELNVDDIIQLTKIVDEFLIIDREDIIKSLMFSFKLSITKDNWLTTLKEIYGFDCYKDLVIQLLTYFRDTILVGDEFLKDDPLKDIELDSKLGKHLYKVVLKKLAYLNKQLGYNKPYVKKEHVPRKREYTTTPPQQPQYYRSTGN